MPFSPELSPRSPVMPVGDLVRSARLLLEQSFPLLWVGGEISNLTRAASGHWYFSLKDANAQVRCVMFRNKNLFLDWAPENGMQVEVRALATLYEARGEFQLNIETMRRSGLGALYEAFEKLKAKLDREGLFEASRKRELPPYPRQIGIVTSPAAAALKDVLTTLKRRMPSIPVILYPAPVQGEGAAEKLAAALRLASARAECDVLILCRGGGSIEDLWAFNEEVLARAVADCTIPVVCGVGHETDFTIADFIADQRAPTPTAAAELVTPDRAHMQHRLQTLGNRFLTSLQRSLEQRMQRVDFLARRLLHPGDKLAQQERHLTYLHVQLKQSSGRALDNYAWRVSGLAQRLQAVKPDLTTAKSRLFELQRRMRLATEHAHGEKTALLTSLTAQLENLNPRTVLARGFSIVETEQGKVVRDYAQAMPGSTVKITLARGWLVGEVKEGGEGLDQER